ncbi:MAG: hypothetical protein IJK52_05490 [Oscillospiraceae bacterium]|nr:hypothetical protein [Oscillospiraceae bacterium]
MKGNFQPLWNSKRQPDAFEVGDWIYASGIGSALRENKPDGRAFDVNDLILNTSGALISSSVFYALSGFLKKSASAS